MTIENLKEFFKQIGFDWTGKIFDSAWHVVPFGSDDQTFTPKTFEEILKYEQECDPMPRFVFIRKDWQGNLINSYHSFRVIPERFEEFRDYDDGLGWELGRGINYTEQWLEFQKGLGVNLA